MGRNDFQVESNLGKIRDDLFGSIEQRIARATVHLHGKLVKKLSGQRSGRLYPVKGTGRVVGASKTLANGRVFHYSKLEGARYYRASAPLEPPAQRLGDLRTSYQFKVQGHGADTVGVVGSPLPYAVYLEKGTSNMVKRPHLRQTYLDEQKEIPFFFEDLIK